MLTKENTFYRKHGAKTLIWASAWLFALVLLFNNKLERALHIITFDWFFNFWHKPDWLKLSVDIWHCTVENVFMRTQCMYAFRRNPSKSRFVSASRQTHLCTKLPHDEKMKKRLICVDWKFYRHIGYRQWKIVERKRILKEARSHRRSQGVAKGAISPQIFRKYSHFVLWEAFFLAKYCYSAKIKHFGPPNFWAGYATARSQVLRLEGQNIF